MVGYSVPTVISRPVYHIQAEGSVSIPLTCLNARMSDVTYHQQIVCLSNKEELFQKAKEKKRRL